MRTCVVGCGAIGSIFAATLAQLDDVEVWAYDTDSAHVDAINNVGLGIEGEVTIVGAAVRATTHPSQLPPCDFGIILTKATHTKAAIQATAHAFQNGVVATLQSGIGNEEIIARQVQRVAHGTTFNAGTVLKPGHVQWDSVAETTFGAFAASSIAPESIEQLGDVLHRAGLPTSQVSDPRSVQWRKAIFSAATNAVAALTGLKHGLVCELPATRELVTALVDEGKAVATAEGINLDADPLELLDEGSKPGMYSHIASMLADVRARQPTEVEFLNGAIARFGRKLDVPTPLHLAVLALIRGIEESWSSLESSGAQHAQLKDPARR